MKVEDQPANAHLPQAPRNDLQGGLLLGDEEDLLAVGDGADDHVRDRLRLPRSRRPFDDNRPAGQSLRNDLRLGRVRGHGQARQETFQIRHRCTDVRVGELLIRSIDEMSHQRVARNTPPGLLKVLPQTEGAELEEPEVGRGLDVEGQAVLSENSADDVEKSREVEAGIVLRGLA